MRRIIRRTDTLITPAATPPMTVEYARRHIKALTVSDDVMIRTWIEAAAQFFREQTGREILNATYELWLDEFPSCNVDVTLGGAAYRIELPHPPLQEVLSVLYVDGNGTVTSHDDGGSPPTALYTVKAPQGTYASRGWIEPASGQLWPSTRAESGAVRIQYVAGYGDAVEDVPELITGILCYLVGHFDRNRLPVGAPMSEVPLGLKMMMDGFRYSAFPSLAPRAEVYWP